MEKNTEYGAMAILSASSYGNQSKIESGGTTTGNKSGVYINLNKEWVSAGSITKLGQYANANGKYKNIYTNSYAAKNGDAIGETAGWHGSGASRWLNTDPKSGLVRAYSGSIFSYYGFGGHPTDSEYAADCRRAYSTRACIVVGTGF